MIKIFKQFNKTRSRKSRVVLIIAAIFFVIAALGWYRFSAFAQSIIDSFIDTARIYTSWNVDVDTVNGHVTLDTKNCDNGVWFCDQSTVCANTLDDGLFIVVARAEGPTRAWKTSLTSCDQPQCSIDGGQDGDSLVSDLTVDFSLYPAQNYCKSIGGRLPTKDEYACIYTNRTLFGNNFGSATHWSATEASSSSAWYAFFQGYLTGTISKTNVYNVRCVMGW
ncbi:MAG: hypothetical protein ACWGHO_04110 [Candidatus Moraniibacteriota bacterium]